MLLVYISMVFLQCFFAFSRIERKLPTVGAPVFDAGYLGYLWTDEKSSSNPEEASCQSLPAKPAPRDTIILVNLVNRLWTES